MTTHQELELVSPFLDGELDAAARTAFEAHLSGCAECTATIAAIRATVGDLKMLGEAEMPEQVSWALRGRIAKARNQGSRAARIAIATGSVAALLAGIVAVVVHKPTSPAASGPPAVSALRESGVAPAITTSDANYTAANVRDVFTLSGQTPVAGAPGANSPTGQSATRPGATSPKYAQSQDVAQPATEGFQNCVDRVRAGAHDTARPVLYLVARYNGAQAFFMVFDVPADSPTRQELWIVRPGTCGVLRLEQRKL